MMHSFSGAITCCHKQEIKPIRSISSRTTSETCSCPLCIYAANSLLGFPLLSLPEHFGRNDCWPSPLRHLLTNTDPFYHSVRWETPAKKSQCSVLATSISVASRVRPPPRLSKCQLLEAFVFLTPLVLRRKQSFRASLRRTSHS